MAIDKEKQYKRQQAWTKANKERIVLDAPKGTRESWKAQAASEGISLTEWIIKKCQGD